MKGFCASRILKHFLFRGMRNLYEQMQQGKVDSSGRSTEVAEESADDDHDHSHSHSHSHGHSHDH